MPNLLYGYCFYYLSTFVTEYCDIFDSSRCSTAVVSNHSIFSAHVPIVVRLQQVCRDELLSEKLKFMKYNSFCLKLKFLERLQIDITSYFISPIVPNKIHQFFMEESFLLTVLQNKHCSGFSSSCPGQSKNPSHNDLSSIHRYLE